MKVYVVTVIYDSEYGEFTDIIGVCADLNSAMRYVHERYQVVDKFERRDYSPITWCAEAVPDTIDDDCDCFINITEYEVLN